MTRSVHQEMKRILGLMDRIKDKPAEEQVALIRAHVAATAQEVSAEMSDISSLALSVDARPVGRNGSLK